MSCSDQDIIRLIRSGQNKEENQAIRCLIKNCKAKAIGTLAQRGLKDAHNQNALFIDALMILFESVRTGRFEGRSKLCVYLIGIAKNLWLKELDKQKRSLVEERPLEEFHGLAQKEQRPMIDKELLEKCFRQLGDSCRELFIATLYKHIALKDFAEMHDLRPNTVVQRNKRCMEKLRKMYKDNL